MDVCVSMVSMVKGQKKLKNRFHTILDKPTNKTKAHPPPKKKPKGVKDEGPPPPTFDRVQRFNGFFKTFP